MRFLLLFHAILAGFFLESMALAADVFLGTSKHRFEKISIGIVSFQGKDSPEGLSDPEQAKSIALAESVFKADIDRSQLFRVIKSVYNDKGTGDISNALGPQVTAWAQKTGVLAIAWVKLYPSAEQWVMEAYAYEVREGKPVIRVRMMSRGLRSLVHRFADKLIHHFTGKRNRRNKNCLSVGTKRGPKPLPDGL